jgi:purine-binding chemotaxis protein CheW
MSIRLLEFTLNSHKYAVHLDAVERVVPMVEVTPLPHAPGAVMGIVNLQGRIIPVFDLRKRFGLEAAEPSLTSQLVLARTARWTVLLPVDSVIGLAQRSSGEITHPESIAPGIEYIDGVAATGDGMVLIHDLDRFLSVEEEQSLRESLNGSSGIE